MEDLVGGNNYNGNWHIFRLSGCNFDMGVKGHILTKL